ncbi:type IV secretion system protein [Cupriavidus sp. UYPR2.512]|uniref:type IV secretion system protein n=1 Tax=Cupriavidus sp. UYPR2.512 TaxID=1080187 RepID=UPI000371C301|nr:type IV secretion system protein [Cupriavidus sp. UYPR2.512]
MIKLFWTRSIVMFALSLILVMPVSSYAEGSSSSCSPLTAGDTANWDGVKNVANIILSPINSAQSTISSKANSMASSATPIALTLAGVLALSYFLWGILDSLAGSGDSFMGIAVGSLIPAAIVAACLGSYAALVGTSGGLQGILSSFTQAATGSSTASSALASFAQQMFNVFASSVKALFQGLGCINIWSWTVGIALQLIFGSLILIIALVVAVVAIGELVGVLLTGIVMVAIGVAVGPLFVACAVCKWSAGFFRQWLKFLLGASAYQMIISVILSLVSSMLTSAQDQISSVNPASLDSSAGVSFAGLFGLLGITWVLTHLFKQIPQIAHGLIGGGAIGHASFTRAAVAMGAAAASLAEHAKGSDKGKDGDKGDAGQSGSAAAGGGGDGSGGGGGMSGPSVTSESGSFSAAPQVGGPSANDAGSYSGTPQLSGPSGGDTGEPSGSTNPGGPRGDGGQWEDLGDGWQRRVR